jgi:predicted metal-dependent RNase
MSFKELKDEVAKIVPKGSIIRLNWKPVTSPSSHQNPHRFAADGLIGRIAKRVRRTIVLRPSEDIMISPEDAKRAIEDILPESAGLKHTYFDACLREITLICDDPGEAVGRRGAVLNEIATPPVGSSVLSGLRLCCPRPSTTSVATAKPTRPSDASC